MEVRHFSFNEKFIQVMSATSNVDLVSSNDQGIVSQDVSNCSLSAVKQLLSILWQ